MSATLQIGKETLESTELIPLIKRYKLLPQLERNIMIDRAIADIQLTPDEYRKAHQRFDIQHNIFSEETRQTFGAYTGFSSADIEILATRPAKIEKFKQQRWEPSIGSYFLQRKDQLDRVTYSMIRTQDGGLAQELYFRLKNKEETFANLAERYSEGPEARLGGLVGPVALERLHPDLARTLRISNPGQLWPVSQLGQHFVILRFEEQVPVEFDDGMKQKLLDECFENWLTQQMAMIQ